MWPRAVEDVDRARAAATSGDDRPAAPGSGERARVRAHDRREASRRARHGSSKRSFRGRGLPTDGGTADGGTPGGRDPSEAAHREWHDTRRWQRCRPLNRRAGREIALFGRDKSRYLRVSSDRTSARAARLAPRLGSHASAHRAPSPAQQAHAYITRLRARSHRARPRRPARGARLLTALAVAALVPLDVRERGRRGGGRGHAPQGSSPACAHATVAAEAVAAGPRTPAPGGRAVPARGTDAREREAEERARQPPQLAGGRKRPPSRRSQAAGASSRGLPKASARGTARRERLAPAPGAQAHPRGHRRARETRLVARGRPRRPPWRRRAAAARASASG